MRNSFKIVSDFSKKNWSTGSVLLLIFIAYYSIILFSRIPTDLQPHAKMAFLYAEGQVKLPPNFLYFFLVALLTGFSKQYSLYYIPTVLLLSAGITAKFFITKFYAEKLGVQKNSQQSYLAALAMLFVFALPGLNYFSSNEFLFGQLVSNVWHNSTTIFLMPFSILLFFESYTYLFDNKAGMVKNQNRILLLLLLNALIKPSFLFTLLPSVFILFFARYFFIKKERSPVNKLYPYLISIIFIVVEYYFIYKLNYVGNKSESESESGIVLEPFAVWRSYSPNCIVAFFTSCFFPLVFIAVTNGRILKSKLIQFSLCNYIIGLLLWILLAEEGFRKSDGNFFWQMVVVSYLFFFTLLIEFINSSKLNKINQRQKWIIGLSFFLHFIWGVFYWLKIIIYNNYG